MAARKSLGNKLRFEVFKRDSFRCQYCGNHPPHVVLEVDHLIPVAEGGENEIDNLMTSCVACNSGKGAGDITVAPQTLADKMESRKLAIAQLREYDKFLMNVRRQEEAAIDAIGRNWFNRLYEEQDRYTFAEERVASVRRFLKALPRAEILEAIDIAFGKFPGSPANCGSEFKRWKYFCGCCWNKIREASGDA